MGIQWYYGWVLHLDLFSGIGGFALAADTVFGDVTHIFCDNEPFSQAVLKKHWPEAYIYGDIRSITDTPSEGWPGQRQETERQYGQSARTWQDEKPFILTGGFPCQPFSAAGLRRGTADDRHLWPEMLRVIRLTEPEWVIAENVGGILTWNEGMVFEQVCADLEAAGYTVQPFVIPAVAVNAPHRRDRVWFVAHATGKRSDGRSAVDDGSAKKERLQERYQVGQPGQPGQVRDAADAGRQHGRSGPGKNAYWQTAQRSVSAEEIERPRCFSWDDDWAEVAAEFCSVDDGLPVELDGLKLSKPQHRKEQLKAYGNAIVPQVAMEIMKAIKEEQYA